MVKPLKFEIDCDSEQLCDSNYRKELRRKAVGLLDKFYASQGYPKLEKSKNRKRISRPKNRTEEKYVKFDGYWFGEEDWDSLYTDLPATLDNCVEHFHETIGDDFDAESFVDALVEEEIWEEHEVNGVTMYQGCSYRTPQQIAEAKERKRIAEAEAKVKREAEEAEHRAKMERVRAENKADEEAREELGMIVVQELRGKYVRILEIVQDVEVGITTSDDIWSELRKLEIDDLVPDLVEYITGELFGTLPGGRLCDREAWEELTAEGTQEGTQG
jgi:hypothetical protein